MAKVIVHAVDKSSVTTLRSHSETAGITEVKLMTNTSKVLLDTSFAAG